jgi:polyhydroxyalkanoate synthesis regulator phasin
MNFLKYTIDELQKRFGLYKLLIMTFILATVLAVIPIAITGFVVTGSYAAAVDTAKADGEKISDFYKGLTTEQKNTIADLESQIATLENQINDLGTINLDLGTLADNQSAEIQQLKVQVQYLEKINTFYETQLSQLKTQIIFE